MRVALTIYIALVGFVESQILDKDGDSKLAKIVAAYHASYGDDFGGVAHNAEGKLVLLFAGREFVYNDGRNKTFGDLLETPDIEDTFMQIYPINNPTDRLSENFDPGRFRVEGIFKALYGSNEKEVLSNCEHVNFCGHRVNFNSRCGAADALCAVGKDLDSVFEKKPKLREYVAELGGGLRWRFITGTNRLSSHSFGIAIDLNVRKSHYWRWDTPSQLETFTRKDWPTEIIETFERHGFIWGGKWWHYDTMHFEYRPEIISFARALAKSETTGEVKIGESERSASNGQQGNQ